MGQGRVQEANVSEQTIPADAAMPLSFRERFLTPGNGVAFVLTILFVYYAWGLVFTRDGTGSNVVLGLLMAVALLYLVTTHLGALIDNAFFSSGRLRAEKEARFLVGDLQKALGRIQKGKDKDISAEGKSALEGALLMLKQKVLDARAEKDDDKAETLLVEATQAAAAAADKAFGPQASTLGQLRSLVVAFAIALALRAFVVEPFQIPSGSMIPTLEVGDHLFVARFWYGVSVPFAKDPKYVMRWSTPKPGDVVVFVAPPWVRENAGEDWIKRVIAGPGQTVRIEQNMPVVDGVRYDQEVTPAPEPYMDFKGGRRWEQSQAHRFEETIPGFGPHAGYQESSYTLKTTWPKGHRLEGLSCNEDQCTVKDGFIFVMGDNRDNSNDGRSWGAVPIDNVKGKALFIWMSVDGSERSVDLGRFTLPAFRWSRLFQGIQ